MAKIICRGVTFEPIEAIIFDKDGTLADSAAFLRNLGFRRSRLLDAKIPGVQEPLLMAFGLDNAQINPAGLLAVGTRQENEIAAAAYVAETGRDWIEAMAIVQAAFAEADRVMQRKADQTPLFPGALALLESLTDAKLKVGILSSDITPHVEDFVQRYQLASHIQLAMGTDGMIGKPNPILLLNACEALNVLPSRTLVVGDSQADVELARSGGAGGCIGATWGWANLRLKADVLISEFGQIQVLS